MSLQEQLLDLDETVDRISKGINAVVLMSTGLDKAADPYADGFYAVCDYLTDAGRVLRTQLDDCLKAV